MKINNIIKIIISFFIPIIITSCAGSSTTPNPTPTPLVDSDQTLSSKTNNSCTLVKKNFSVQSLDSAKRPNENFKIKILQKSFTEPIMISNTYRYPLVFPVDFKGIKIEPAVIETDFHKALTPHQLQEKRKRLWKEWKVLLKEKYKYERKYLINQQKEERIIQKNKLKELLETYPKGSLERENFIREQIELRKEIAYEDKDDRKELKNEYIDDIKELKKLLNISHDKENKNFSTKHDNNDNDKTDLSIVNISPETEDYNSINQEKSFKINSDYVDGVYYSDEDVKIIDDINSYYLSNAEQISVKTGININGCTFGDNKLQKLGNKISIIFDKTNEDCGIQEISLEYRITSKSPNSCGQSNTILMKFPPNKSFAVTAEIPFQYLGYGEQQEAYFNIKKYNGTTEKFKIADLIVNKTDTSDKPIEIQDFYNYDNIEKLVKTNDSDKLINDYVTNYKFNIKNTYGRPFYFSITDQNNKVMCNTNCLSDVKGDNLITIDKSKFLTGEYNIILTDSKELDKKIIAKKTFFVGNYPAYTFSTHTDQKLYGDSAMVYYPSNTNTGYFDFKEIQSPESQGVIPNSNVGGFFDVSDGEINKFCNINEFKNRILDSNNQGEGSISYSKYLFSEVFEYGKNKFVASNLNNCPDKSLVVGGMVDLTNPDKRINKALYDKNVNVLLSLVVEDESCNEITSKVFGARLGTKFLVSKQIFPNILFGNFCEKKLFYVKVKKLVDASPFKTNDPLKAYYNNNTQNKTIDMFSIVKNLSNPTNKNLYEGNKTIVERCPNGLCHINTKLLQDAYSKFDKQIQEIEKESKNVYKYKSGDDIDVFSNGFNFNNEIDLESSIKNSSPLTNSRTIPLDSSSVDKINSTQDDILGEKNDSINPEYTALVDKVSQYKAFLDKQPNYYSKSTNDFRPTNNITFDPKIAIDNIITDSTTIRNKMTGKEIYIAQGKILATTIGRVFYRYNYISFIINGFIEQRVLLENKLTKAKEEYINTVSMANKVLAQTITDECKKNASNLFLTRVRRYVINFVTDPLYELNKIVDNSNPETTPNYSGKVEDLRKAAVDTTRPRAVSAQDATNKNCDECDPNSFTILAKKPCPPDFERFTNEEEASEAEAKQGLFLKSGTFNQNKWIALPSVVDPRTLGDRKFYTHKIEIYVKNKNQALSWLDLGKPISGDGNGINAEFKSNEPNRWGIFPNKLSDFNLMIKKIQIKKR